MPLQEPAPDLTVGSKPANKVKLEAKLPNGYMTLWDALDSETNTLVNVIGVVVDLMPPKQGIKGSYVLTCRLLDPLYCAKGGSSGLKIRFFCPTIGQVPRVESVGDIVLLRQVKRHEYAGEPLLLSAFQTQTLVFAASAIPDPRARPAMLGGRRPLTPRSSTGESVDRLSTGEQDYIIKLHYDMLHNGSPEMADTSAHTDARKREGGNLPPPMSLKKPRLDESRYGPKFRLVRDLKITSDRHTQWADVLVLVIKTFPNRYGKTELYTTDYTPNSSLFYYTPPEEETEDQRRESEYRYSNMAAPTKKREWPGPWGQHVFKVNAADPHSSYVNHHVNVGDLVLLQNVKLHMQENDKLEGDLWRDNSRPERIQVQVIPQDLSVPEISSLFKRKKAYEMARSSAQMRSTEPQAPADNPTIKQSKNQRKKERRRARAQEYASNSAADKDRPSATNPHVRSAHQDITVLPIRFILDRDNVLHRAQTQDGREIVLPFINARYRTRVRVIGFEPRDLTDFAISKLANETSQARGESALSLDDSGDVSIDFDASQPHEWSFSLLLEDAMSTTPPTTTSFSGGGGGSSSEKPQRDQLWVHVHHEHAQHLFGNDVGDPQDLRTRPEMVAKLREKLSILWGNLLEKMDADDAATRQNEGAAEGSTSVVALSNVPFECCLAEYGVELDADDPERAEHPFGWMKMFGLFGTTIP